MQQPIVTPKKVTSIEEVAEKVFILSFKRDFTFKPGQVIGIGTSQTGPRRLYSICSGNNEVEIQILFNLIDDGYLTPRLSELEVGDQVYITEPRGEFLYDPSPAFWIASGTGIAPFISMIKSGCNDQKILIHGERYLERFYFYDELNSVLGENYIRCCSSEEGDKVIYGRVTEYLRETDYLPKDYKYYLCGRAEMVVETRDILIEKKIPFSQIVSEIYF